MIGCGGEEARTRSKCGSFRPWRAARRANLRDSSRPEAFGECGRPVSRTTKATPSFCSKPIFFPSRGNLSSELPVITVTWCPSRTNRRPISKKRLPGADPLRAKAWCNMRICSSPTPLVPGRKIPAPGSNLHHFMGQAGNIARPHHQNYITGAGPFQGQPAQFVHLPAVMNFLSLQLADPPGQGG